MSAKRNILPRECPKCRMNYGTVQMVFFAGRKKPKKTNRGRIRKKEERYHVSDNAVIRIGHYSSKGYDEAKKENISISNDKSEEDNDRNLRSSQRKWCSFRSEVLDDYAFLRVSRVIDQTVSKPISAKVWNRVIEVGWRTY